MKPIIVKKITITLHFVTKMIYGILIKYFWQ